MRTTLNPITSHGKSPSRRRSLGLRVGASAVAAVAMLLSVAPVSADQPTPERAAAEKGAVWLGSQLDLAIPLEVWGSPDWGTTVEAATALASVDLKDSRLTKVWDAIVANRETVVAKGGADVPGALAKVILLAHSIGKNPRSVGEGPGADLVKRLADTRQASGLYGSQAPNYDGVYRQGMSIAALVAAGETPDPSAVSWLVGQQCSNGDFTGAYMPYRADTSVDCADDPDSWFGADTNATALAITGLDALASNDQAVKDAISRSISWLDDAQGNNGGWSANSWSPVDPNSTAVVTQALIAAEVFNDERFNNSEQAPLNALRSFQIASEGGSQDDGAFRFPGAGDGPNLMASVQAVPALAGRPLIFAAEPTTPTEPTTTTTTTVVTPTTVVTATTVPEVKGSTAVSGNTGASVAGPGERPISFTG